MKLEVQQFIQEYADLCERIADGRRFYPLMDRESARKTGEDSFIDYVDNQYLYGSRQRGVESISFKSHDKNEIMYYPIYAAFWRLAMDYEVSQRVSEINLKTLANDSRAVSFKIFIQYMKKVNIEWAKRLEIELSLIAQRDGFSISD